MFAFEILVTHEIQYLGIVDRHKNQGKTEKIRDFFKLAGAKRVEYSVFTVLALRPDDALTDERALFLLGVLYYVGLFRQWTNSEPLLAGY